MKLLIVCIIAFLILFVQVSKAQEIWRQYVVNKNDTSYLYIDGKYCKIYDNVVDFEFSPDGHFFYVSKKGLSFIVVIDGQEGQRYYKLTQMPFFSQDGRNVAYIAESGLGYVVVINNIEGNRYSKIIKGPFFYANGQHSIYIADKGFKKVAVIDGKEIVEHGNIMSDLIFSPDGNHVAYSAEKGLKRVVVHDGIMDNTKYEGLTTPFYSPDSRHLVYCGESGNDWVGHNWVVVIDGKEDSNRYDGIEVGTVHYSSNSDHWAYIAKLKTKRNKWVIVCDGKVSEFDYDGISNLIYSRDGNHLAYSIKQGSKWCMMVDGKRIGQYYDGIAAINPVFSPNGERIAFTAKLGKEWHMVVDGKTGKGWDGLAKGTLPIFSSNNEHVGYITIMSSNYLLVIDDQIIKKINDSFENFWEKNPIEEYFGDLLKYSYFNCDQPLYIYSINGILHNQNDYLLGNKRRDKVKLNPGINTIVVYYNETSYQGVQSSTSKIPLTFNTKPGHVYCVRNSIKSSNFSKLISPDNINFNILKYPYKSTGSLRINVADITEETSYNTIENSRDTSMLLSVLTNKSESLLLRLGAINALTKIASIPENLNPVLAKLAVILNDPAESPQILLLIIIKLNELGQAAKPAVPYLIKLLNSKIMFHINNSSISLSNNSLDALKSITKNDFGYDQEKWAQWWSKFK